MHSLKGFHKEVIEAKENRAENLSIKQTVDTSPLKNSGSNFTTHKLIQNSSTRYSYVPSIGMILFGLIINFIGIGIVAFYIHKIATTTTTFNYQIGLAFLVGTVFFGAGVYLLYEAYKPRVFDKKLSLYYQTFFKNIKSNVIHKNQCPLADIVALQIIGEQIIDDDGSFNSFELNLVLKDNSRRNVIDHINLKAIIKDAKDLSYFLDIPIWHATSHTEAD